MGGSSYCIRASQHHAECVSIYFCRSKLHVVLEFLCSRHIELSMAALCWLLEDANLLLAMGCGMANDIAFVGSLLGCCKALY